MEKPHASFRTDERESPLGFLREFAASVLSFLWYCRWPLLHFLWYCRWVALGFALVWVPGMLVISPARELRLAASVLASLPFLLGFGFLLLFLVWYAKRLTSPILPITFGVLVALLTLSIIFLISVSGA